MFLLTSQTPVCDVVYMSVCIAIARCAVSKKPVELVSGGLTMGLFGVFQKEVNCNAAVVRKVRRIGILDVSVSF